MSSPPSPLVSIVIPTLDRVGMLEETLQSIRAQSYPNWEAIVVDDHSSDDTLDRLRQLALADGRVRPFVRGSDRGGAPVCRNEGLEHARGDLVVFMDSDDLLMAHALEARVAFLDANPGCDATISVAGLFRRAPGDMGARFNVRTERDELDRFLLFDIPWCPHAATWRRRALPTVGPWDEDLPSWQDWDYHVRALVAGIRLQWNHEAPDCHYRTSNHATLGDASQQPSHLRSHEALITRTHEALRERGLLSRARSRHFHGVAYWLAERWALEGDRAHARHLWRASRRRFLVPPGRYATGRTLLESTRTRLAWKVARRAVRGIWPLEMFPWESATYHR